MIKEFDLDAPGAEKPKRLRFRDETRCVTALLERCYEPSKETGKPWKILVEVVDRVPEPRITDLLGVLTTKVECDIDNFLKLENGKKKTKTLELLMRGIERIAESFGFDMKPFDTAAEKVRQQSFVNEWIWGTPVYNNTRTMSAELLVNHDVEAVMLFVRIRDSDENVIEDALLVSDRPNEFVFDEYFGSLSWLDEKTVELASRSGEKRYIAKAS